ncbi:hypothetical protein PALA111701_31950 [Paenibacillus lactis]
MREVKPLGRRFFWVKSTGNIVAQRNEMSLGVESTKEEDFQAYIELQSYDPQAIEMTTFEPGQHKEEFEMATDWRFNPETGEIEFLYSGNPGEPPVYRKPLTQEVDELNTTMGTLLLENANDKATIASLEDTVGSLLLEVASLKGGA